ncbi:CHAP domain-containing protein [Flexibacter flexilis DSM 6793]|uniref:CHAP domain-containing protein n=1 Tax=Flexibacter flexilis DSM 6793 TaxID=927664 RepID=A0A1I1NHC6_9BACT|nr:CHAP domain-containing protein [Flexibacter flexilis]SFC93130.1 CHAP domain-containing protein [Flexibacter flexilis DSM 6793]
MRFTLCLLWLAHSLCVVGQGAIRNDLAQTYLSQVGIREATGRNDGTQVEMYLHSVKAKRGQSWCAAFVSWCLQQHDIPHPQSAWSPALFPKRHTVFVRGQPYTYAPQRGDVFGLYYTNLGRIGHVGFIEQWDYGGKFVITVEGNTNEAGSRQGDGVYRKKRPKRTIYKIANFIDR